MDFRTVLSISPSSFKIEHKSGVLLLGSCFAERIGEKFTENKFNTMVNPCGVIFNPLSLASFLNNTIKGRVDASKIVMHNENYFSFDYHSSIHASSQEEIISIIKDLQSETQNFLKAANVLILTLGTGFVFDLINSGETVANCHKLPASNFSKRLLTVDQIVFALKASFLEIQKHNPSLKVVLTVSPVRHVKDTLQLNSVSKSILRLACHYLEEELPFVNYFPSFEIINDDLRDYRFFKDDLIHPTEFAEEYIWNVFSAAFFSGDTIQINEEWKSLKKRIEHRPFNSNSPGHQKFVNDTLIALEKFNQKVNCEIEIQQLKERYKVS